MARHPYIQRRGNKFGYRRRVPSELQEIIGRKEWKPSLGGNYEQALEKARLLALQHDQEIAKAKRKLAENVTKELSLVEIERLTHLWFLREYEEIQREENSERLIYSEDVNHASEEVLNALLDLNKDRLTTNDFLDENGSFKWADDLLADQGINLDKSSDSYFALCRNLIRSAQEGFRRAEAELQGDYTWQPSDPVLKGLPESSEAISTVSPTPQSDTPVFSVVFDKYLEERKPPKQTAMDFTTYVRRFKEVNGDLRVDKIARSHVREFKDALLKLPAHQNKAHRAMTVPELLKAVQGTEYKKLSRGSVNKALNAIKAVLSWAVTNGYIESNPATKFNIKDPEANKEKRLPYDEEDMKKIFTSPIYTKGKRPKAGCGEAAKWLPVLALFTGARLEELGQSLVTDIKEEQGITFLHLTTIEEGKRLKTKSSRRKVPIHPQLVRMGFLDYVEQQHKAGRVQLFPDLRKDTKDKLTGHWSRWFGRYQRDLGITDRKKVFHSFRHTFKDACRRARIPIDVHDAITGHSGRTVADDYGSGSYPLEVMADEIAKVEFPSLDLRELGKKTGSNFK